MEALQNYKAKLAEIQKLVQKLENGELQINELSVLEQLTREIHERSIILRYKAFEKKKATLAVEEAEVNHVVEEVDQPEVDDILAPDNDRDDDGGFDFELFDSPDDSDVQNAPEEPIIEIAEVDQSTESSPVESLPENEVKTESETSNLNVENFVSRVRIADDVMSQFSVVKINSLIGAFGLNDRLRFINELFDGSSEKFGDAIKLLDSFDSLSDASPKIDALAAENNWDPEDDAVEEFIVVLKRRYA